MHLSMQVKTFTFIFAAIFAFVISGESHAAPRTIEQLQNIEENYDGSDLVIGSGSKELDDFGLNLKRDAQREAALSFGARGGLARRNFEIMEALTGHESTLERVFNFRQLMINAPSGLLIEPPVIRSSMDNMVVSSNGVEAAVADRVYNINKSAKIVSAPRNWRQYLDMPWESEVEPPPTILWPENEEEKITWSKWIQEGWKAGIEQADESFEANLTRLVADFNGMIKYKMLVAQGMISRPYAMHEDRGVTVTKDENMMRVGDRALKITGPSQFQRGAERWRPADQ